MTTVIVTDPEYRKAAAAFDNSEGFHCIPAPPDEAGLAAKIRETGARHVVIGTAKYIGPLYDALPAGGVIARFGVGHDGVDKRLAAAKGILCCNTPGVLDDSVAECAIGLMLSCARRIPGCAFAAKAGAWPVQTGTELRGKILAIIGYGNIGSRVAGIAKQGLGMKIIAFGRREPSGLTDAFATDFSAAVRDADVVSLHIPAAPATRDFIDATRLRAMKSTAILINTARGSIVDEDALHDAVASGAIAGAALDVFKSEPYQPQSPGKDLRSLDRIIMTPHIGSSTREACERMAEAALRNIAFAVEGRTGEMNLLESI